MRKGAARGAKKHARVVSQARDLKTGKTYTGENLMSRSRPKFNAKNNKNISAGLKKGHAKSNLQKKVSNAQKVINRDPRSCAEHQAVSKLYKDRPSAKPSEIQTCTVLEDAKTGKIQALKRCDNCMQFGDAMGSVPTDEIAEMVIVKDPGYPVSKNGAAMVAGSVALATMKRANDGESSKANKHREKTDSEKVKTSKRQVTALSGDEPIAKEEMLKIVTKITIRVKIKVSRKYRTYRGRVGNSKMKHYSVIVRRYYKSTDHEGLVKVADNQSKPGDSCDCDK